MQNNDRDENVLTCTDGVRVIFDDDGVLVEHLGVLLSVLWNMCFFMESPIERHVETDLSRLTYCNGVPVKQIN